LSEAPAENRYQFERTGYFCAESKSDNPSERVFHRTISLKDRWAKAQKG